MFRSTIRAVAQRGRKLMAIIFTVFFIMPCFATHNKNWTEWNVPYYDWSDKENEGLVMLVQEKINMLEAARGMQGINNPLVREKGIDVLYGISLRLWSDYLKFSLCNADGLQFISKEEIEVYDEIFPTLHKFAIDYYNGIYTNGKDPNDFLSVPPSLKRYQKGVMTSIENMATHFNIKKYLDEPYKVPSLSKKRNGHFAVKIIFIVLALSVIAVLGFFIAVKKIKIVNIFTKSKRG